MEVPFSVQWDGTEGKTGATACACNRGGACQGSEEVAWSGVDFRSEFAARLIAAVGEPPTYELPGGGSVQLPADGEGEPLRTDDTAHGCRKERSTLPMVAPRGAGLVATERQPAPCSSLGMRAHMRPHPGVVPRDPAMKRGEPIVATEGPCRSSGYGPCPGLSIEHPALYHGEGAPLPDSDGVLPYAGGTRIREQTSLLSDVLGDRVLEDRGNEGAPPASTEDGSYDAIVHRRTLGRRLEQVWPMGEWQGSQLPLVQVTAGLGEATNNPGRGSWPSPVDAEVTQCGPVRQPLKSGEGATVETKASTNRDFATTRHTKTEDQDPRVALGVALVGAADPHVDATSEHSYPAGDVLTARAPGQNVTRVAAPAVVAGVVAPAIDGAAPLQETPQCDGVFRASDDRGEKVALTVQPAGAAPRQRTEEVEPAGHTGKLGRVAREEKGPRPGPALPASWSTRSGRASSDAGIQVDRPARVRHQGEVSSDTPGQEARTMRQIVREIHAPSSGASEKVVGREEVGRQAQIAGTAPGMAAGGSGPRQAREASPGDQESLGWPAERGASTAPSWKFMAPHGVAPMVYGSDQDSFESGRSRAATVMEAQSPALSKNYRREDAPAATRESAHESESARGVEEARTASLPADGPGHRGRQAWAVGVADEVQVRQVWDRDGALVMKIAEIPVHNEVSVAPEQARDAMLHGIGSAIETSDAAVKNTRIPAGEAAEKPYGVTARDSASQPLPTETQGKPMLTARDAGSAEAAEGARRSRMPQATLAPALDDDDSLVGSTELAGDCNEGCQNSAIRLRTEFCQGDPLGEYPYPTANPPEGRGEAGSEGPVGRGACPPPSGNPGATPATPHPLENGRELTNPYLEERRTSDAGAEDAAPVQPGARTPGLGGNAGGMAMQADTPTMAERGDRAGTAVSVGAVAPQGEFVGAHEGNASRTEQRRVEEREAVLTRRSEPQSGVASAARTTKQAVQREESEPASGQDPTQVDRTAPVDRSAAPGSPHDADARQAQQAEQSQASTRSIIDQIVQRAELRLGRSEAEMVIDLKPDVLGRVHLKITAEAGRVLAEIRADSTVTRSLIEAGLPELKTALAGRGLALEAIAVSADIGSKVAGNGARPGWYWENSTRDRASRTKPGPHGIRAIGSTAVSWFSGGRMHVVDCMA